VAFINRMNGRTLLFIGDSVTESAFESLGCQLWHYVVEKVLLRDKFGQHFTEHCDEFSSNLTAEARAHPMIDETFFAKKKEMSLFCGGAG